MSISIKITDRAKSDMREIYKYINEDLQNHIAAERRIALIETAIRNLKMNYSFYPPVPDEYLASRGFKMDVVKNHIVFFIVHEETDTIFIMRVLYARRDWKNILRLNSDTSI